MFVPRLTIPEKGNPYYTAKSEGGLNPCTPRPSGSKLRFANCVFYSVGRFAEVSGIWMKSTNAENFVNVAKEMGLTVSQKPVIGAIAVWSKGKVSDGLDGAGHVANVEVVNKSGSIVTSESGWNAKQEFWTTTRKDNGNWGQSASYSFLGFVLPPESSIRVLREGDHGEDVKAMQQALAQRGYLRSNEVDGDFGIITLGAVLCFQFKSGLEVDGVAGPKTQAELYF